MNTTNYWGDYPPVEICTILREDMPELPEDDILSATTFIIGMVDKSLERIE